MKFLYFDTNTSGQFVVSHDILDYFVRFVKDVSGVLYYNTLYLSFTYILFHPLYFVPNLDNDSFIFVLFYMKLDIKSPFFLDQITD